MSRTSFHSRLLVVLLIGSLHHGQGLKLMPRQAGNRSSFPVISTAAPRAQRMESGLGNAGPRHGLRIEHSTAYKVDALLTANGAIPRYWLGAVTSSSKGRILASTSGVGSAAHIFASGPGGQWFEEQKLVSPGSHVSFGSPVALFGDIAMIAANGSSQNNVVGAVYVFRRIGSIWTEAQQLRASDAYVGDHFGQSMKLFNDTAFISNGFGNVYEFTDDGSSWTEQSTIQPSPGASVDFGGPIDCSETTLIVGDSGYRPGSKSTGAVYVFERYGNAWQEQALLIPSNRQHLSRFGSAVALSGNQVLVGAYSLDWLGAPSIFSDNGAVFVFTNTQGLWSETQEVHASDGGVNDAFGWSVEAFGDSLFVGSPGHKAKGAVYSFERRNGQWMEHRELIANRRNTGDNFGYSLSLDGGTIAVGAPFDDENGLDTGSVYVLSKRSASSLAAVTTRSAPGNTPSYTATPAALGLNWRAMVDMTSTNHSMVTIHGYLRPARVAQPNGQTLLLDLASPRVFRLAPRAGKNGSATWSLEIPNIPSLSGITVYTQAIHFSPSLPASLSNAQDLFLGY